MQPTTHRDRKLFKIGGWKNLAKIVGYKTL